MIQNEALTDKKNKKDKKKDKKVEINNCDVSSFINRLIRLRIANMNSLLGMFFSSGSCNIDHNCTKFKD